MIRIQTKQLELVALDIPCMQLYVTDRDQLVRSLGLKPYRQFIEPLYQKEIDEAMPVFARKLEQNPQDYPWYSAWEIVLTAEQIAIGGIGFAGPPDEKGNITLGYHICKRYWSKGLTSEAAAGILEWAFGNEAVKTITAYTPVEHIASQKVLLKNGFTKIRQEMQEGMAVFIFKKSRMQAK
ncbi:MAG: N-acetyltransferase GCN5 [Bacteroidetes bacterium]|nr:MAG: N-acetyltransferase GCN5 [Bacteroidota bacterium]